MLVPVPQYLFYSPLLLPPVLIQTEILNSVLSFLLRAVVYWLVYVSHNLSKVLKMLFEVFPELVLVYLW